MDVQGTTTAEDAVHAALGIAVVTAVYADGRAHVLGLPDSFFTPWHAFLYGGLALMVVWLVVISWITGRRSGTRRLVLPSGYRPAAIGAGVFAAGGVFDMVWHLIFGVEFGIDALLSPSHLTLFVGGGLLLSAPILARRQRLAPGVRQARLPAFFGVVAITALAGFALSFLSAFLTGAPTVAVTHEPEGTEAHNLAEGLAAAGLGSFLVTTVLLVAPTVYLLRTKLWFPGAVAGLVGLVATGAGALAGFANPWSILSAFVAGAMVDALVAGVRTRSQRGIELTAAAAVPLLVWTGQLLTVAGTTGLGWSAEMAIGVVLLSALGGVTITLAIGRGTYRAATASP